MNYRWKEFEVNKNQAKTGTLLAVKAEGELKKKGPWHTESVMTVCFGTIGSWERR